MIDSVPRPRPPYLHHETTRHGVKVWYVRKGKGPRIRIKAAHGSPEFMAEYQAALSGAPAPARPGIPSGSIAWLIERYRDSAAWAKLSATTRYQREKIFARIIAKIGKEPASDLSRKDIATTRDAMHKTPFLAANFMKAVRGLFRWAFEADLIKVDPTDGVTSSTPKTDGFHAWTEDEISLFEARWPVGTRERLALALLLFTGLRRGDVASVGRQHVSQGVLTIRAEKTGAAIIIPILPELAAIIAASKTGDLAFIAKDDGAPMTKESFGNWFKKACVAAGVPGSAHGLRKAGATRAANNGATVAQLEAIFGWSGGNMAALYTKKADRVRIAREAIGKLAKG